MPQTKETATEQEKLNYLESLLKTISGVDDAIVYLSAIRSITGAPDVTRRINVKLLDLEAERAKLQAELLAYSANESSFNPPSDKEYNEIIDLSEKLDGINAEAHKVESILEIVTNLIEKWNKTRV